MRTQPPSQLGRGPLRKERGTILIIALIVLVAMTLAGIATMRSVDTATVMAGNIGLRQSTSNAADQGIQAGVAFLQSKVPNNTASLINDDPANGYFSSVPAQDPDWNDPANWGNAVQLNGGAPDAGGNVVFYIIQRMCKLPNCDTNATCGSQTNLCASTLSTSTLTLSGSDQTRPTDTHTTAQAIHYRVTAKAQLGSTRGSVSIVQTMVRAL